MNTFREKANPDILEEGKRLATIGALARARAVPGRDPQKPYPPVRDSPMGASEHLRRELLEGLIFIFTTKSEPFAENLMGGKLTYVEQHSKIRYIRDPRLNINERTSPKRHPFMSVPPTPSIRRGILYWKRRYPEAPILLPKRDLRAAFKLIPLSIEMFPRAVCMVGGYLLVYLSLYI